MDSPLLELETLPAKALYGLLLDQSLTDLELVASDGAVLPAHRWEAPCRRRHCRTLGLHNISG